MPPPHFLFHPTHILDSLARSRKGEKEAGFAPFTMESGIPCPSCHALFPLVASNFEHYMAAGDVVQCPECREELDWWAIVVESLTDGFLGMEFAVIRSRRTLAHAVMKVGEPTQIDLTSCGVPESAQILYVNYTGQETEPADAEGALAPLEMHSNTPHRDVSVDRPLMLYPMPLGEAPPSRQDVAILVVWIDKADLGIAESSLVAAVEAFNDNRWADAVVSAAAAVETSIQPVVSAFLERFAEKKPVEGLLRNNATGQIEVLLPAVCKLTGAPLLPEKPRKAVQGLRKLRNKAAHEGHLPKTVSKKKIAEAVTSAVFAVEHARVVGQAIRGFDPAP
jgi:hypothetical protein